MSYERSNKFDFVVVSCFIVYFSIVGSFLSFADTTATASNVGGSGNGSSSVSDLLDDDNDLSLFRYMILERLDYIIGGLIDATPSDAIEGNSSQVLAAEIYGANLVDVIPYTDIVPFAIAGKQSFINCIRFDVSVNGTGYTLLFSSAYKDQLWVDSGGHLWNMGTSQVQGLVVDGWFDAYQTQGTLVYLAPCLGNNFNVNYNYGSPNWFRRYYRSGSTLNYTDTYVRIEVDEAHYPFVVSDVLSIILIFIVGGGVCLCWFNRSKNY